MAARIENWPAALAQCVADHAAVPFEWGVNDCGTFAVACERAICGGVSTFDDLAGVGYKTAKGWERCMRKLGFSDPHDLLASRLRPIAPLKAQRGDWVLVATRTAPPGLAVVMGAYATGPGPTGLLRYPLRHAIHAYKVGD